MKMAGNPPQNSQSSITEANRYRSAPSLHGGLGAAGYISQFDAPHGGAFLTRPGEVAVINPPREGPFPDFEISVAWDRIEAEEKPGLWDRLLKRKKTVQRCVDLDLGCLYRLKNGRRGGMQAFGAIHGAYEEEPYIFLSGDERTGAREGPDETIRVNGAHWDAIEQILIYVYIYKGAVNWAEVRPQIQLRVPGEEPMVVTLAAQRPDAEVCAVAGIENIRGGVRMTSYLEYFPGHFSMDRAFGYGLAWEQGRKDPAQ
ncbi:MAG: Tellurium resistance protein TerA [Micavibrio sp.]